MRLSKPWLGVGAALVLAACSDNGAGPGGSACVPGQGTLVALANPSTTDSAEYLLVPQSAAGVSGQSSPFVLRAASAPLASGAADVIAGSSSMAARFDAVLRNWARTRAYPTPRGPVGPAVRALDQRPTGRGKPAQLHAVRQLQLLDVVPRLTIIRLR